MEGDPRINTCSNIFSGVPELGEVCKAIVESHEDILMAALLNKEEAVDFYVRTGLPVPDDFRTENMIIQTQLVVSMVKENQDFLGELSFIYMHMGKADVLHVPVPMGRVLAVVIKPQKVANQVISAVLEKVNKLS